MYFFDKSTINTSIIKMLKLRSNSNFVSNDLKSKAFKKEKLRLLFCKSKKFLYKKDFLVIKS